MTNSEAQREASRALFQGARAQGIAVAALRDDPFSDPPPLDLDLLVGADSEASFRTLLGSLGYVTRTPGDPRERKFVAFKALPGCTIHVVDVHLAIVQDGLVYMDAAGALARRVEVGGGAVLGPEDTYLHLVFHELIGRSQIRPEKAARLAALVGRGLAEDVLESQLESSGLSRLYRDEIDGKLDTLAADPEGCRRLRGQILQRLAEGQPGVGDLAKVRSREAIRSRLLFRKRGPLVAVSGPDGSGKSTFIDRLNAVLDATPGISVATIYLGPWGHYLLGRFNPGGSYSSDFPDPAHMPPVPPGEPPTPFTAGLAVLLRRAARRSRPGDPERLERVQRHSPGYWRVMRPYHQLRFALFVLFLGAEYAYRFYRVRRDQMRGHIVVADRYVDDLLLGGMHNEVEHNQGVFKVFQSLWPRPDRMVVLLGDPEVIHARKQDLELDTLRRFMAFYRGISEQPGACAVHTDVTPDEVVDRFLAENLQHLVFGADESPEPADGRAGA